MDKSSRKKSLADFLDDKESRAFSKGTDERTEEVLKLLFDQQESDRGCVMFGASILDDDLKALLRACCLDAGVVAKKVVDPLFNVYAPFSSFSAKIQVSYALGLISEESYTILNSIRKIRNDFAHERNPVSFQSPKYRPRFREILIRCKGAGTDDRLPVPDENETLPGMGSLTIRQIVDRLVFCICIDRMSFRISLARDFLVMDRRRKKGPPAHTALRKYFKNRKVK
jgi:DNA-binding MltR family transcriptional regulator